MHAPVLGQMNWLGMKVHEHNSVNVELERKEMASGLIDCDDTEYTGKIPFAPDGQRPVPDE